MATYAFEFNTGYENYEADGSFYGKTENGLGYFRIYFKKTDGTAISSGNIIVGTLPTGYRPRKTCVVAALTDGPAGNPTLGRFVARMQIEPDGRIRYVTAIGVDGTNVYSVVMENTFLLVP